MSGSEGISFRLGCRRRLGGSQEGLDFHPYCHAIVHWNLPSNPVDLEQREGRIHRYKGHAVRKNVAFKHGSAALMSFDPWKMCFTQAVNERGDKDNDLVPFWIYPLVGGSKIERYVPCLPLSSEVGRYETLKRSLAVYRMVFGQPRQDDLLVYLMDRYTKEQIEEFCKNILLDLSPR